jgi:hypothetical protein
MSTDRDTTRIVRSWLEEGATALPDRVLDAVLNRVPATRQRRSWWPAWRFANVNAYVKFAMAAAAVVVVAAVGYNLLPGTGVFGGPKPTASPTPSPAPFANGPLTAGSYVMTPFTGRDSVCAGQPQCSENPAEISIRVTVTVPEGYEGDGHSLIFGPDKVPPPYGGDSQFGDGVLLIERGASLYIDPCHVSALPGIAVGPTVEDFANAIAAHPFLDATDPVDVTLAGYSGKYIDLQLPADVSGCTGRTFRPWEPGIYAQGNNHRWHLWILDVRGVRVVVHSMDWPSTSPQRMAEIRSIVDSIQIMP